MRERLVILLVGITLTVIALFGIPRAYAVADLIEETEHAQVVRATDVMAVAITARRDLAPITESYLSSLREQDERLVYIAPDRTRIVSGPARAGDTDFMQTRQLRGGGRITVSQPEAVVTDQVSKALLPLIALALALAAVAAVIALFAARRLARPFQRLAESATEIGNGRFDVHIPHSSIPEAEEVGESLRRASGQLDQLVRRERDFAITASHELRTPITALRLSLEDLTLWPQTPADVAEELTGSLAELDRLNMAITRLLDGGDATLLGTLVDVDLTNMARAAVDRWRVAALDRGRQVVLGGEAVVPASVVTGPVEQVLDVLVEHALARGSGRITVTARAAGSTVQVRVADESPREIPPGVLHETAGDRPAADLSLAAGLAESMDGYLGVGDAPLTTLVLALPRAPGTTTV